MNAMTESQLARYAELRERWQAHIQEIAELPDGYAFGFLPDSDVLLAVAEFITLERLCCPFLQFELVLEAEGKALWLRLHGREGVKAFIQMEFGTDALDGTVAVIS
jgi:hypothetical protein